MSVQLAQDDVCPFLEGYSSLLADGPTHHQLMNLDLYNRSVVDKK